MFLHVRVGVVQFFHALFDVVQVDLATESFLQVNRLFLDQAELFSKALCFGSVFEVVANVTVSSFCKAFQIGGVFKKSSQN